MPTEDQLKSKIQAAIAKKKQAQSTSATPAAAATGPKVMTPHPAIFQPAVSAATPTPSDAAPTNDAVATDAELTRSFFGRPIRVGIYNKQVYFAIQDVLNMSNTTDYHQDYNHHYGDKKGAAAGILRMMFPSPNGGHDQLDAATADVIIDIIGTLKLSFPEPIEKWLNSTTESLKLVM